jgi:23S rRNA (pseudouridine1915-N3)-methyltransferase
VKINIVAIGKFKDGANKELFETYKKRVPWEIKLKELALKGGGLKKEKEGELLLQSACNKSKIIALDEGGKMLSSREFSTMIQRYRDNGDRNLSFIIGGAEGLSGDVKNKSDLILSFGKMTFPHMMIRGFLMEQIYRAYTLINNHPYHKD